METKKFDVTVTVPDGYDHFDHLWECITTGADLANLKESSFKVGVHGETVKGMTGKELQNWFATMLMGYLNEHQHQREELGQMAVMVDTICNWWDEGKTTPDEEVRERSHHTHPSSWVLVTIDEGIIGTVEIHKTEEEAKDAFKSIYGYTYDEWCDSDSDAHAELKEKGITTEIVEIKPL